MRDSLWEEVRRVVRKAPALALPHGPRLGVARGASWSSAQPKAFTCVCVVNLLL